MWRLPEAGVGDGDSEGTEGAGTTVQRRWLLSALWPCGHVRQWAAPAAEYEFPWHGKHGPLLT